MGGSERKEVQNCHTQTPGQQSEIHGKPTVQEGFGVRPWKTNSVAFYKEERDLKYSSNPTVTRRKPMIFQTPLGVHYPVLLDTDKKNNHSHFMFHDV